MHRIGGVYRTCFSECLEVVWTHVATRTFLVVSREVPSRIAALLLVNLSQLIGRRLMSGAHLSLLHEALHPVVCIFVRMQRDLRRDSCDRSYATTRAMQNRSGDRAEERFDTGPDLTVRLALAISRLILFRTLRILVFRWECVDRILVFRRIDSVLESRAEGRYV